MFTKMTLLTRTAFSAAMDEMLTVDDAIHYLEEELKTRSLRSKLEKFSGGRDEEALKRLLVSGLLENDPKLSRESADKRVSGWMKPDRIYSLRKPAAIETAFILGLDLPRADEFVTMVSGEHLHWRSVKEIIYIYALKNGLNYLQAADLENRMKKYFQEPENREKTAEELEEEDLTNYLRAEIETLRTEEDLRGFLERESGHLGQLHNQAYLQFTKMIHYLTNPVKEDPAELWKEENEHLTVKDILREYLFQNPVVKAKGKAVSTKKMVKKGDLPKESQIILTRIQKSISDTWPDETTLAKMNTRKKDVTRKTLILLFLATYEAPEAALLKYPDGNYENYSEEELDELLFLENKVPTRDDVFADIRDHIDLMLSFCGFAPLDPRSPFDWLILYCICAEDLLAVEGRMRSMFLKMFGRALEETKEA